jgi:type II secretory pathway component PulC
VQKPAPKPPDLPTIQAILFSSSHPSVVLNGIPYQEGETVRGMKILKIARDKVIVQRNGQTMELH